MLPEGHSLLTLAIILVAGVLSGKAVKRLGLPAVTGQVLVGVVLGPSALAVVSAGAIHDLRPLTHFALGLIAMTVGNHLNIAKLRNMWGRLALLLAVEVLLTPLLVFAAMHFFTDTADWTIELMFGAMAIATAPATVIALVKETRARGLFVKTLVAAVALNNMACILLFEIARMLAHESRQGWTGDIATLLGGPLLQLVEPIAVGAVVGGVLVFATRSIVRSDLLASSSIIALLFAAGFAELIGVSPLLSCLFLGMSLANFTPDKDEVGHRVFQDFEGAIYAVFFVLAGLELDLAYLAPAGLVAAVFVVARIAGKLGSAQLAMRLARAGTSEQRYLGWALLPQAGVAIGLVLIARDDAVLEGVGDVFLAVGITSVAINEIIGPLTTRWAIKQSGEAGRDRPRLIDFLHDEHIVTDLGAVSMEQALDRLAGHLVRTHDVSFDKQTFVRALTEQSGSDLTYLGHGLAMPHARIGSGRIVGVMGISREGLVADTPDGQPVHCVVLMASPEDQRDRHLEVVAAFATAIGHDRGIERELYAARTPAFAYEVLHAEDAEDFNYFLDEDQPEGAPLARASSVPPASELK